MFNTNEKNNLLYIPITTDRSCCGSINNIILDRLKNDIQSNSIKDFNIFLLGKKGKSITKKLYSSEYLYSAINLTKYQLSIITVALLLEKVELVESANKEFDSMVILFNYFKNIVTQVPSMIKFISLSKFKANIGTRLERFSYLNNSMDEEKSNNLLEDLYSFSFSIVSMKCLYENEMSEYGARASAMRNASKNAEEVIKKLQTQYNKARQANITNELIEIISCVNSIVSSDSIDKYSFYLEYMNEQN